MVKMWSDKNQPSLQDKHVWDFDEKCNIHVAGPCLASCILQGKKQNDRDIVK